MKRRPANTASCDDPPRGRTAGRYRHSYVEHEGIGQAHRLDLPHPPPGPIHGPSHDRPGGTRTRRTDGPDSFIPRWRKGGPFRQRLRIRWERFTAAPLDPVRTASHTPCRGRTGRFGTGHVKTDASRIDCGTNTGNAPAPSTLTSAGVEASLQELAELMRLTASLQASVRIRPTPSQEAMRS